MNSEDIINVCLAEGFAQAGIASATCSDYIDEFKQWLADGKHGEMGWLEKNVSMRLNPQVLLGGARSVVCVADRYGALQDNLNKPNSGKIARYARGSDYHKVMKKRLHYICDSLQKHFPEESFRACVDTAPVMEREFSARAGIGSIGKHTLLLDQGVGSWFLLGVIVTTAKLQPNMRVTNDPCSTCTRCIDSCPTDALTPWHLDARRCVSYLTIEHRTIIDPEFFEGIGHWLFGCDVCQEVCPHNQLTDKKENISINPEYSAKIHSLNILEVMFWDEKQRREAFRGSSMKRAKLGMIRRNAIIVAGNILRNQDNSELRSAVKKIAAIEEDELVKRTAEEVLKQLD